MRRRQIVHERIQEGFDPAMTERGTGQDRNRATIEGTSPKRSFKRFSVYVGVVDVELKERLVDFSELLYEASAPVFHLPPQGFWDDNGFGNRDTVDDIVPDDRPAFDEINDAFEAVFSTDGALKDDKVPIEFLSKGCQRVIEICAGAIELVDEREGGDVVGLGLAPDLLRLRFNAGDGVQEKHGAVEDAKRTFDFNGEVGVSGCVDDLNRCVAPSAAHRRRRDRDPHLLFLHAKVRGGVAVMNFTLAMNFAGAMKDAFGKRGLAGVDMRDDANVAECFVLAGHGGFLSAQRCVRRLARTRRSKATHSAAPFSKMGRASQVERSGFDRPPTPKTGVNTHDSSGRGHFNALSAKSSELCSEKTEAKGALGRYAHVRCQPNAKRGLTTCGSAANKTAGCEHNDAIAAGAFARAAKKSLGCVRGKHVVLAHCIATVPKGVNGARVLSAAHARASHRGFEPLTHTCVAKAAHSALQTVSFASVHTWRETCSLVDVRASAQSFNQELFMKLKRPRLILRKGVALAALALPAAGCANTPEEAFRAAFDDACETLVACGSVEDICADQATRDAGVTELLREIDDENPTPECRDLILEQYADVYSCYSTLTCAQLDATGDDCLDRIDEAAINRACPDVDL